ncbi:MAG: hypothetical protein ABJ205_06755 [Erythrobacter sp.]|uniref:hypothetical protein n=1 Tax=Erythrobacter sp. TaxID=1042 RepID=UPI003298CFCB
MEMIIPRGMLYLYDWENDQVEIPEYREDQTVSATSTALSIALISDEDGNPTVKLGRFANQARFSSSFGTFTLKCPNKLLSLCTMGDNEVQRLLLSQDAIEVNISGNSRKFPSEIFISSSFFVSVE